MNRFNSVQLDLLSKRNYEIWRMQMKAILIKKGLWKFVNGSVPCPDKESASTSGSDLITYDKWIDLDQRAKTEMCLSICPSELVQLKDCKTSRDVWLKLEEIYQSKDPAKKVDYIKKITLLKMNEDDDLRDHMRNFFDLADKLAELEVEINDDLLCAMLLYSLPASFEDFRCAIEASDESPTLETLRIQIEEEWNAKRNDNAADEGATASSTANTFEGGVQEGPDNDSSLNIPEQEEKTPEKSLWCLGSGSTSHLCNDEEKFCNLRKPQHDKVNMANGEPVEIKGSGTVRICSRNTFNQVNIFEVDDVLCVPEVKMNLLSISKLTDKGLRVIFEKNCARIIDRRGRELMKGGRRGDLYYVEEDISEVNRPEEPQE